MSDLMCKATRVSEARAKARRSVAKKKINTSTMKRILPATTWRRIASAPGRTPARSSPSIAEAPYKNTDARAFTAQDRSEGSSFLPLGACHAPLGSLKRKDRGSKRRVPLERVEPLGCFALHSFMPRSHQFSSDDQPKRLLRKNRDREASSFRRASSNQTAPAPLFQTRCRRTFARVSCPLDALASSKSPKSIANLCLFLSALGLVLIAKKQSTQKDTKHVGGRQAGAQLTGSKVRGEVVLTLPQ